MNRLALNYNIHFLNRVLEIDVFLAILYVLLILGLTVPYNFPLIFPFVFLYFIVFLLKGFSLGNV